MPYLVTTNKPSTSALHCVSGLFFGNRCDTASVVVNHGTRISLYDTRRRSVATSESDASYDFGLVIDVPIHGTVKSMESLPIVDPATGLVTRHILFLLTEKQSFLVLAFERTVHASADAEGGNDEESHGGIVVHSLYAGAIESLFFQGHINGEECTAATGNDFISSCSATSGRPLLLFPTVCVSIFSGTLFVIDIAAALAEAASPHHDGEGADSWRHLFPGDFWSQIVAPRKGLAVCNIRNVEENTVCSLAWATLPPSATSNTTMTLYVLYSDRRFRSHVAEYSLELVSPTPTAGRADVRGAAAAPASLSLIMSAISGQTKDSPVSVMTWRRVQTIQSDVEADAALLHPVKSGVVVVGPQLVTFINSANSAKSSRRANVVTVSLPMPASKVPSEPRCVTSIDSHSFVVALTSGALIHVEAKPSLEEFEATLMPNVEEEIRELVCTVRSTIAVVPECITYFSAGYCFVGSHFSNSVLVDLQTGESSVVINNIGPILDMTVVEDGPRMLVVASTGLNRNGALRLLRSAVSLVEEVAIPEMESVRRVDAAGPFVCLSLHGGSRFLRRTEGMLLEEVSETSFDELAETVCFGLLSPLHQDYIQVTHDKVRVVRDGSSAYEWISPQRIQDAFVFSSGCCVCAGPFVFIFTSASAAAAAAGSVLGPASTLRCASEVSCAALTDAGELFVGEWSSNTVKYLPKAIPNVTGSVDAVLAAFDVVPRSIQVAYLSGGATRNLVVSFPDGTVSYGKIPDALDISQPLSVSLSSIKLSSQPIGLTLVDAHDSTVAILCTGDVPSVIYESHGRVQVTGVALRDVESYATLRGDTAEASRSICFTRSDATIRIGRVGSAQRISTTTLELKQTITKVSYLSPWRCFAVSLRMRDRDDIFLFSLGSLETPSRSGGAPAATPLPLMEAERCVFIESLAIGGPAASLNEVAPIRSKSDWNAAASGSSTALSTHFQCVMIGTSFIFPEEPTARSSRLVWATVEAREGQGMVLAPLGEKDIVGALSACCMVPNCPGRVALAINGSIHLYRWNALERDLVCEANVVVGSLIAQVVPVFPKDCRKTGILVAGDCRYSVAAIRVNVVDSAIEVMCRDQALRPVMSLVVTDRGAQEVVPVTEKPTLQGCDVIFSDEHLNLFSVEQLMKAKQQADGANARRRHNGGTADDDDDESAPPESSGDDEEEAGEKKRTSVTFVPEKLLQTTAQVHIGDRVNCLRVGTFAALPSVWANLIPGAQGQQLVFGTCHGALGSIIPLGGLAFTFLSLLEASIREVIKPIGGLSPTTFREVLARGKQKRLTAAGSLAATAHYEAKGFCDGDVVESFVELPRAHQKKVAAILSEKFAAKAAVGGDGFPEVEKKHKKITITELLVDSMAGADEAVDAPPLQPTEQQLEDAVEAAVQAGLPAYPFTDAALRNLVSDLSRAH